MAKKENKNPKTPSLRVIKIVKYKDASVLIQTFTDSNIFQCIVFWKGNFYQAHQEFLPDKTQKAHTLDDIVKCGAYMLDVAFQIVDALEEKTKPNIAGKVVN